MQLISLRPPRIGQFLVLVAFAWHWLLPMREFFFFSLPLVGMIVGLGGFLVMMWAWWSFQKTKNSILPTVQPSVFLTSGAYRFSRHPMYLGMVLMLLGLALFMGTFPFYLAAITFFVILHSVFCSHEELLLEQAFGNEFQEFRKSVRRWI